MPAKLTTPLRAFHLPGLTLVAVLGICAGCTWQEINLSTTPPVDDAMGHYRPAEQLGELFHDVQMQQIFADGKTFVDAEPKQSPAEIRQLYHSASQTDRFDLGTFVNQHFEPPTAVTTRSDEPVETRPDATMENHIVSLWDHLSRTADPAHAWSSLLPLSHPYVVPGGRFREIYYWDSYFTMLGLAADQRVDLVRSMVRNFADLIDRFGHIPNGNRTYYLSRSQPPFFAPMLKLLTELDGPAVAARYLPQLEQEYRFWMDGESSVEPGRPLRRIAKLPDGSLLNRYYDDLDTPRPESYREDVLTAAEVASEQRPDTYRNLRAAAESGWDFSSRWLAGDTLASIETTAIVPVDLNSLLYQAERMLSEMHAWKGNDTLAEHFTQRADRRKTAMHTWLWNPEQGVFYDYHLGHGKPTGRATLAMVYPLYFEIATQAQADSVARYLRAHLLHAGGFVTSLEPTGEQWDYPNGWAPLQWLSIHGLRQYGHEELAREAAARWLALNRRVFERTGRMMEKYNVVDMKLPAGGGEYPLQDGFGWTNGVVKALMQEWSESTPEEQPDHECCE